VGTAAVCESDEDRNNKGKRGVGGKDEL